MTRCDTVLRTTCRTLELPGFKVALGVLSYVRKQTWKRPAARDLFFGELVIQGRGRNLFRDRVDDIGGNDDHAVAVADDNVARVNGNAAARDWQVEIERLMHNGTRR